MNVKEMVKYYKFKKNKFIVPILIQFVKMKDCKIVHVMMEYVLMVIAIPIKSIINVMIIVNYVK